jgi:NAD(P)-dependent dehydrogenase (short-subunit alcohol dehydrogenase family)
MGDRLDGLVAVVTGGSSGIGEATVQRFEQEGARVIVADLQIERGQAVVAPLGDAARFVKCDVTSEDDVAAAIQHAVDTWGQLDVMMNNAGIIGAIGPIAEMPTADWMKTIDVLMHSVFYGCKHAAKVMIPRHSGSIISTSSIAGVIGGLGPHAYTAAKTAVVGLTKSVASELGMYGIRVNAIAPGTIPTPLTAVAVSGDATNIAAVVERSTTTFGVVPDPIDIANAALYLASAEGRLVNGHTLVVDAGRSVNGGSARFASSDSKMLGIAGMDNG